MKCVECGKEAYHFKDFPRCSVCHIRCYPQEYDQVIEVLKLNRPYNLEQWRFTLEHVRVVIGQFVLTEKMFYNSRYRKMFPTRVEELSNISLNGTRRGTRRSLVQNT